MKKCPYCAEEIQDEAVKCKHCGEFIWNKKTNEKKDKKTLSIEKYINDYEKRLKQNYPNRNIVSKDIKESCIVLNKEHKFNIITFLFLSCLFIIPGLLYAFGFNWSGVLTATLYFDKEWDIWEMEGKNLYLMTKYNEYRTKK